MVVAIINYKGGVGKTTISSNLGASLAKMGKKVLLIDLDPQSNLTFSLITINEWRAAFKDSKTIKIIFDKFLSHETIPDFNEIITTPYPVNDYFHSNGTLDLICSHLELINIDLDLASNLGGGSMQMQRHNFLNVYSILSKCVSNITEQSKYDVILIDCPPNMNVATKNAIVASDYYIIPARADYLSTLGVYELTKHINELSFEYNENIDKNNSTYKKIDPKNLGIIFTMLNMRNGAPIESQEYYIESLRDLDIPIFDNYMRYNASLYSDAPELGIPISVSKVLSSNKHIAKELDNLGVEFLNKVGII